MIWIPNKVFGYWSVEHHLKFEGVMNRNYERWQIRFADSDEKTIFTRIRNATKINKDLYPPNQYISGIKVGIVFIHPKYGIMLIHAQSTGYAFTEFRFADSNLYIHDWRTLLAKAILDYKGKYICHTTQDE